VAKQRNGWYRELEQVDQQSAALEQQIVDLVERTNDWRSFALASDKRTGQAGGPFNPIAG